MLDTSHDATKDHLYAATTDSGVQVDVFDKSRDAADLRLRRPQSGSQLGFELVGAATGRTASGSVASAMVGHMTVRWTRYADRIKEDLELSERPNGDRISFKLGSLGLTFAPDGKGGYAARNGNGTLDFYVLPPTVIDANGQSGSATLAMDSASGTATIQVSSTFLDRATYPVVVDPTVVFGTIAIDGSPVTVTISNAGDNAQGTFNGTAGQQVGFGITSNSFCGTSVAILKPDGTTLQSNGYVCHDSDFDLTLPTTGTYTIQVNPGTSTGSLTLTLSSVVTASLPIDGAAAIVSFSRAGQDALVSFSGTAGQALGLALTNGPSCWLTVSVMNPDGTQLKSNSVWGSADYDLASLPATGAYSIRVEAGTCTGSLTLELSTMWVTGTALTVDGTASTTTFARPSQDGRVTFMGSAGQSLGLAVISGPACWIQLTIQNPNGTTFQSNSVWNTADFDLNSIPQTGTYTIQMEPGLCTGTVSMELSTMYVPGSLSLDGPGTTLTFTRPGTDALVSFDGTANQAIILGVNNGPACWLSVNMLKPDGTSLTSTSIWANGTLTATLPITGTYNVRVEPGLCTGSVTLSFGIPTQPNPTGMAYADAPTTAVAAGDVNTYTGAFNYTYAHIDIAIAGRGPTPGFVRSYNSNDSRVGALGLGWTHNYAAHLSIDSTTQKLILVGAAGRSDAYTQNQNGTFSPPLGVSTAFARTTDPKYVFTATFKDGTIWSFSGSGLLLKIADRYGNVSALTYTGGRLESVSDPAGRGSLTFAYNTAGTRLASVTDWASPPRVVQFGYDGTNRLQSVTDRNAQTTTYAYDTSDRLTSITDARHNVVVSNTYDSQGKVLTQNDADNQQTSFAYDTSSACLTPTAPNPPVCTTTVTYPTTSFDGANPTTADTYTGGLLTQRVSKASGSETYNAGYHYTSLGFRDQVTDGRGNTTYYCWDVDYSGASISGSLGNLTRRIEPSPGAGASRPATLFKYDSKSNLLETVPPKGVASSGTTGCTDNLSAAVNALYVTTNAYDSAGQLVSTTRKFTDPDLGQQTATTKYEYSDAANPGRVTRIIPPRGNTGAAPDYSYATRLVYYGPGSQLYGLLQSKTDALNHSSTYSYDAVGRMTSMVDPNGQSWQYTFDNEDRPRLVKAPSPAAGGAQLVTESRYDAVGNRTVQIDANGQVTTYAYDARNQLQEQDESPNPWTDPAATPSPKIATVYTYDNLGHLSRVTRAAGDAANERATDYGWDGLGRLRKETQYPNWPSTSPTLPMDYGYDANGNQTTVVDPLRQTTTFGYDTLNRVTSIGFSDGQTAGATFAYDANGNRTSMADGTGTTAYSFDELNHLTAVTSPGAQTVGYRWDLDGNRTKLIYPDATAVTYTFNKASQLTTLADWASRSTSYSYGPDSHLQTVTNANSTTTSYSYDQAQRLTQVLNQSGATVLDQHTYSLDAVGNRTQVNEVLAQVGGGSISPTTTYSYDRMYRLTGDGTNSYTYDPVGNRLTWNGTSYSYDRADRVNAAGSTSYTVNDNGNLTVRGADTFIYDQANRLKSLTSGGSTSSYAWDGDGKRASSTVGGTTTTFMYDVSGSLPLLLSDGARKYVYGQGLAYSVDNAGNIQVSHADALGSVRALTDGSGSLVETYRTDAFGVPTATQGTSAQPFAFTGEQLDTSGLVYLRARMYDPQLGRFIQRDTRTKSGPGVSGWNQYVYAASNPTNVKDSSGHQACSIDMEFRTSCPQPSPTPAPTSTPTTIVISVTAFPDLLPDLLDQEVADAVAAGISPLDASDPAIRGLADGRTLNWGINAKGQLRIMDAHDPEGNPLHHSVLFRGERLVAGGEAVLGTTETGELELVEYNAHTGHYFPRSGSSQSVFTEQSRVLGEAKFRQAGFEIPENAWAPD